MASNVWRQSPSDRLRSEHLLRTWPSAEIADDFFEAPTALEGPLAAILVGSVSFTRE